MGNSSCNCINNDYQTFDNKQKTGEEQITIDFQNQQHEGKQAMKIQSIWKGYKVRSNLRELEFQSNCPGSELDPDQKIGNMTENVAKTEKLIGQYKFNSLDHKEIILKGNNKLRHYSILYPNNSIYIGTYDNKWQKEGEGTLFFSDGSKYTGEFHENKMNGKGRIIYPEGDYYEGDFEDNKPNGFGVFVKLNEGLTYKGEWKAETKCGYGEETRQDGSFYQGNYLRDMKHGIGKFKWPDGTLYEGNLNCNDMDGFGRIIYADNKIFVGEWKCNKMDGLGIFYWSDGKIYSGYYKNDKKDGFGIFMFSNGKKYEGYWLNGKQHGNGICSFKGISRLGEWRFGKKIRWISANLNNEHDPSLTELIEEIKSKSQECLKFNSDHGITNLEDENIKEKLVEVKI